MPAAPRPKGKGKKIAYALLGKPVNMSGDRKAFSRKVRSKLDSVEQLKMR